MRSILVFLLVTFMVGPAAACTLKKPAGSDTIPVPGKIKTDLLSKSILAHSNLARCKKGRKGMVYSKKLTKASSGHAEWMAKARKVTHTSTKSRHKNPGDRLKRAGAKFRTGAENLAATPRMAIPQGKKVGITDAAKCQFTYKGKPVPARSYDSLAAELVRLWINSKVHRDNLLNPNFKQMGAAVGFDKKAPMCGMFFAAQMFTD